MKCLISCLLLSLMLLEVCQAQDDICQDAHCNHARKKRQVVEELLNEVEEVDREKREAHFGKKQKHGSRFGHFSSASARSHGHIKHASKHGHHHVSKHGHHESKHGHHHESKHDHHEGKHDHHHVSKHDHHHYASKHGHHASKHDHHASKHGHHAKLVHHHHKRDADAQFQNCFGSSCNQNNFGKKKRDIVDAINSLTAEVMESEDVDVDEVVESQEKERRDADPQSQNCFGSSCNQNNFGKKKRDTVEDDVNNEVVEAHEKERRDADPQSQNCFGSSCNQNNFGKKKRDVVDAINSLTAEVLESDYVDNVDEVVESHEKEKRDADPQSQNCFGSRCNQNNFGRKKRDIIAAILGQLDF